MQQGGPITRTVSTAGVKKARSNALPLLHLFPHSLLSLATRYCLRRVLPPWAAVWSEAIPKVLGLAISSSLTFSVTLAADKLEWD